MAAIKFDDADRPPLPVQADSTEPARTCAGTETQSNAPFQPLDPDVLGESIPAFFIGRNEFGLWVAREAHGRTGGLFLFKSSAEEFARMASRPSPCALIFRSETFELDTENRGNPLIPQLASWIGRAKCYFARLAR